MARTECRATPLPVWKGLKLPTVPYSLELGLAEHILALYITTFNPFVIVLYAQKHFIVCNGIVEALNI